MVRLVRVMLCAAAILPLIGGTSAVLHAAAPAADVKAHLEAGEFGLAADRAAANPDLAVQNEQLQQVAAAQRQDGAAAAASSTLRRIAEPNVRARAQGAAARESSLTGGGAVVDFQSLINLIQQNTSGQWEDIDGVGGTVTPFYTGVKVAPAGILSRVTTQDDTGRLAALGAEVRKADLNSDMARASDLRLVSLKRLEQEVARRLEQGQPVPESMAHLCGLSEIRYVFLNTAEKDIIIGGPAEAWQYNAQGQPIGVASGRPLLMLDDFVVVLRAFVAGQKDFGCSINTRDAGVRALQAYVEKSLAKGPLNSKSVRNWVAQLQTKLGRQDIVLWGVPSDSRVARVIVEADYRMKLIGIDKLDGGPSIPSYFDLLPTTSQKNPPPMEALRWWLTMNYDSVSHSADRSVFEVSGSSVLCQSENQHLTAEGKHLPTGVSEPTNRRFAENFTNHYADLAKRDLVFADMQNIFDLALVAALIRHERLADRAGWDLGVFAPNGDYRPAKHVVPREIDSVVNHKVYNGRDIVVQVAGGVSADLLGVVSDADKTPENPRLAASATRMAAPQLPAGRWWWDAAK